MSLSTTKTRDYPKVDRMRGVNYLKNIDNTTYTIANEDKGKVLLLNGAATVITVAALSVPVGSQIDFIQTNVSLASFVAGAGVTLHSKGSLTSMADTYAGATMIKTGPSEWTLIGDLA